ncbi:MAG TPA: type II toxin-antitoxin system PemK/MazF family toxin [Thermoanaerobaculia bacterium]|nr:type II toxin-antitoxin system PemK/MazF family toxin [Thermoanaerobaculia bacterium]
MSDRLLPRRGEIWLVDFNPGRGSEQIGQRPALVLQNDKGNQNPRYPNTVVLAMSTQGKPIPFHVRVAPSPQNGLREETYVKCEQVLTLAKERLLGREALGRLTADEMRKVEMAVKLSLALP